MATFSDARAVYGLSATGTPTSTNVSGSVQVGTGQTQLRLTTADVAYSLRAVFANLNDTMVIDLSACDTTGSDAWVAGTAQVETATIIAASGCTSNGTMTLVLTASGLTGSPKNIAVALTTAAHTTAALIATAARTALAADTAVAAMFTIGGTGADITLTRKVASTYDTGSETLSFYPANDATLNLAIPSGLGVTAAATSTNTTAGVLTSGVRIYDADGNDFEGVALTSISTINGVLVEMTNGYIQMTGDGGSSPDSYFEFPEGSKLMAACSGNSAFFSNQTLVAGEAATDVTITIIGTST